MANEKRRTFEPKFKERSVALAKERRNVAQAARELDISASLLRTWPSVSGQNVGWDNLTDQREGGGVSMRWVVV